jgi:hypothetical protein
MDGLFLQTYQSTKKEYVDLLDFVRTQLVSNRTTTTSTTTFCTPGNYKYSQHCNDQQRTKIQLYYDISMETLESLISKEETKISTANKEFDRVTRSLKDEYNNISKNHELNKAATKRHLRSLQKALSRKKRQ